MKFPVKDRGTAAERGSNQDPKPAGSQLLQPSQRNTFWVDRRSSDRIKESATQPDYNSNDNGVNLNSSGYLNLRQRSASPAPRILRNSESSVAMRGQSNGVGGDRKVNHGVGHNSNGVGGVKNHNNTNHNHSNHRNNGNVNGSSSSDSKKGGGTSSGSEAMSAVWPPRFAIGLTTKEKEEDFLAIKGSKLSQRSKKRAKFIQRTLNLASPGSWLGDLTLERYEVREKKVSKKRPRGLRATGNVESDSE